MMRRATPIGCALTSVPTRSRHPLLQQELDRERDAILGRCRFQFGDTVLSLSDRCESICTGHAMRRIIVGAVPLHLKPLEDIADPDQITGKTETAQLFARAPGISVVQGAIRMAPCFVRAVASRSGKSIRTVSRKRMKGRVIGGADRALQIRLPRPADTGLCEPSCRSEKLPAHHRRRGLGVASGTMCRR